MKFNAKTLLGGMVVTALLATNANALQVAGTGTGPIPDPTAASGTLCGDPGAPLTITFPVAGLAASPTNIGVRVVATHSWIGDLTVRLNAPGGAPSFVIFGATGSTTAAGCGDSSNLAGTYNFNDGFATNWWAAAAGVGDTVPVPPANYSATAIGGTAGATGPGTTFASAFTGLSAAAANGNWTLTITDGGEGDTGSITAATLFINETAPVSLQAFSVD